MLDKVESTLNSTPSCPRTPANPSSLDLSLLHSSPPDGTELRKANQVLHDELAKIHEVISPVKRYMQRMTKAFEATQSELITVRKQLIESQNLLQSRQVRKRGKRVALKDRFVYTTEEILQIAKQANEQAAIKNSHKRRPKPSATLEFEDVEAIVSENEGSDADSDCIVVACR